MRTALLSTAAAIVALSCACNTRSATAGQDISSVRQITVTGTGLADAEPDVATIVFGVDVKSSDPGQAVQDAADLMNAGLAAAMDLGVAEEDIKTYSYSLWTENVYDPVTYQPTGEQLYHVTQLERVDIHDMSLVGEVLAAVVDAGVNSVSSVTYRVDDQTVLQAQAREAAIANARSKAEAIAAGLGVQLGEPLTASEYGGGVPTYDQIVRFAYGAGGGGGESSPPMAPGSFSVTCDVTISYTIQ